MKKKIKITESQLNKLRGVIKEQTMEDDFEDGGDFGFPLKMVIMSHLSDVQEVGNLPGEINDKVNFIKKLVLTFNNLDQKISESELNSIYNEISGGSGEQEDVVNKGDFDFDNMSMNESVIKEKIMGEFKRFL